MRMSTAVHTVADYQAAFDRECGQAYPMIDAFEARAGYALETSRLRAAAYLLACPLKAHGRRTGSTGACSTRPRGSISPAYRGRAFVLDIGTAKGFSALCLQWALRDAGVDGHVAVGRRDRSVQPRAAQHRRRARRAAHAVRAPAALAGGRGDHVPPDDRHRRR